MEQHEILAAAKEAGCQAKTDGFITYRDEPIGNMLERFAAIIDRWEWYDVITQKSAN